uniref:TOX high mobility group box family member 4 b n=1 Tax=Cyprinus carpio TaxID=7962 RepID=A0A8C2A0I9_CYPCA
MEFPGGSDSYLAISGEAHHFLSSSDVRLSSTFPAETFHTPSLGDEDLDLDPDSALGVSDVVSDFGELGEDGPSGVPGNAVVGGNDPSFASTFVSTPSQSLEHLSLNQQSVGPILGPALGMDLSQFSSSSPMTIDVPLSDMNPGLLGHNQLTTIDQSELSAQLGLSLPRPQSPDQPLSADSLSDSLQDEDVDDFRRSALVDPPLSLSVSLAASLSEQPAVPASSAAPAHKGVGGKKGKKKKDPNEPQKPVSAYALFFRDTQAAIKGQNPSATFGEVSKIVASMWDSLGEEQKQVYKRKTEAAKKEYLKALAAYKANQLQTAVIIHNITNHIAEPYRIHKPIYSWYYHVLCLADVSRDFYFDIAENACRATSSVLFPSLSLCALCKLTTTNLHKCVYHKVYFGHPIKLDNF